MGNMNFDPSLIDSILLDVQKDNKKEDVDNNKTTPPSTAVNNDNVGSDPIIDQLLTQTSISDDINQEPVEEIDENVVVKKTPENVINTIQQNIDKFSNQLVEDKNNIVSGQYGEHVNYNKIYEELSSLIKFSKEILETLAAIEPDVADPKQIQATASLITSIKGLVSEFSIIHKMNIKHQYNIELENIKQQHRLSTIEYKQEVKNNQQNLVNGDGEVVNGSNTVIDASIPWSSDLALEFMEFMKQRGKKL